MIVTIETANHGIIRGMVCNSLDVVRLLRALSREGKQCVRWRLENVD